MPKVLYPCNFWLQSAPIVSILGICNETEFDNKVHGFVNNNNNSNHWMDIALYKEKKI